MNVKLGFTVKQARMVSGKSQQLIAEMLCVHRHTYMKWEKNPKRMPYYVFMKFCEIVGVQHDQIFLE